MHVDVMKNNKRSGLLASFLCTYRKTQFKKGKNRLISLLVNIKEKISVTAAFIRKVVIVCAVFL